MNLNTDLVLGRFDDVGGGTQQHNELDRVDVQAGAALVFHNSTLVCSTRAPHIVLFDVSARTLNQCGVLQGHTGWARALAAHGDWLASGSSDKTVRIWSMTTRKQLHCKTDHRDDLHFVCYSHNGRWLVSGSREASVFVYDAARDFARRATLMLDSWPRAACFSPDDSMLAVGAYNGYLAIYSVDAFEPLRTLAGGHWVHCVAWLGNDAASLVGATYKGELVVWNTKTGNFTSQEKVYDYSINSLSFTSSFRIVMSGRTDMTLCVYAVYMHAHSHATAALYKASLHVFMAFRSSPADAYLLQRVAEAVAGDDALAALTDEQRNRVITAARVSHDVRVARVDELLELELLQQEEVADDDDAIGVIDHDFHALMHWLRDVAPHYTHAQLAPLGPTV